jgi:transposase
METAKESALEKQENAHLGQENARLLSVLEKKDSQIEELTNELLYLCRVLFGRSSERCIKEDPNQLKLDFGGEDTLAEEARVQLEEARETITYQRRQRRENPLQPVRQPLPSHLERKEEIIESNPLPEGSKCIGEEVTEVLEYTPGILYVRRIVRRKYALPGEEGVATGELPSLPLPESQAGSSLLSHLSVSKYQDHLPFYRQIELFKRQDVKLSPSTVNGWFAASTDLLEPLYETLKKETLSSDYIQTDETTIPVMDRNHPGATGKGYRWIIRA